MMIMIERLSSELVTRLGSMNSIRPDIIRDRIYGRFEISSFLFAVLKGL